MHVLWESVTTLRIYCISVSRESYPANQGPFKWANTSIVYTQSYRILMAWSTLNHASLGGSWQCSWDTTEIHTWFCTSSVCFPSAWEVTGARYFLWVPCDLVFQLSSAIDSPLLPIDLPTLLPYSQMATTIWPLLCLHSHTQGIFDDSPFWDNCIC